MPRNVTYTKTGKSSIYRPVYLKPPDDEVHDSGDHNEKEDEDQDDESTTDHHHKETPLTTTIHQTTPWVEATVLPFVPHPCKSSGRPRTQTHPLHYEQELQQDDAVHSFTCTSVHCRVCDCIVSMRRPYYLFYWRQHKNTRTHQQHERRQHQAETRVGKTTEENGGRNTQTTVDTTTIQTDSECRRKPPTRAFPATFHGTLTDHAHSAEPEATRDKRAAVEDRYQRRHSKRARIMTTTATRMQYATRSQYETPTVSEVNNNGGSSGRPNVQCVGFLRRRHQEGLEQLLESFDRYWKPPRHAWYQIRRRRQQPEGGTRSSSRIHCVAVGCSTTTCSLLLATRHGCNVRPVMPLVSHRFDKCNEPCRNDMA